MKKLKFKSVFEVTQDQTYNFFLTNFINQIPYQYFHIEHIQWTA